ncbi:hypothetical protein SVIOM342S_10295 [Streptomyces violaceorubidus]
MTGVIWGCCCSAWEPAASSPRTARRSCSAGSAAEASARPAGPWRPWATRRAGPAPPRRGSRRRAAAHCWRWAWPRRPRARPRPAMAGAAAVHAPNGFFAQSGGYEYAVSLGLTAAGLAVSGPGRLSLDHALGHAVNRNWMVPQAALAATAAATTVVVGARNRRLRRAAEGRPEALLRLTPAGTWHAAPHERQGGRRADRRSLGHHRRPVDVAGGGAARRRPGGPAAARAEAVGGGRRGRRSGDRRDRPVPCARASPTPGTTWRRSCATS